MVDRTTYDRICAEIKAARAHDRNDVDGVGTVFIVADVASCVIDGITGMPIAGAINSGIQSSVSLGLSQGVPTPNPFFVDNGFEDLESPYTRKYLRNRVIKGGASGAISLVGAIASSQTMVNTTGIAVDANALGSTGMHIAKIVSIAKANKQTITISDWCNTILVAKSAKLAVRTGSLVGNALPIPAASLGVGIATALVKAGVKLTLNNLCYATAASIHWRAFQEQRISGGLKKGTGGKVGPASRIYWEIFRRRGATRLLGQYDIERLVGEPGGWLALGDKLMNI